MNRGDRKEQLLNEVLAERMPASLREALLTQTLRHVRRRRHVRQVRRTVGAVVLLLGLGFLLWPRPQHPFVRSSSPKPYALVQTQPLPAAEIIKTVPLNTLNQIASSSTVAVISTATEPHLAREIDDADLLSLAAPNPVVLVRLGPHSAELVFAHTDENTAGSQTEPQ
jgi:hypothetical protein